MHEVDRKGNTALHVAAKYANKRCLKRLLKEGLDPNALNFNGILSTRDLDTCLSR